MEVICINDDWNEIENDDTPNPVKGEIYTVFSININELGVWYSLRGFSHEDEFCCEYFADISNLSQEIESALKKKPMIKIITTPKGISWIKKYFDKW